MEENTFKKISDKAFNVAAGLFLIFLSIVLALNVGNIAKAFSYVFVYAFGMGAYILYAIFCLQGFFIMFKGSFLKFKFSIDSVLYFLIFLGVLSFVTYFSVNQSSKLLGFVDDDSTTNVFNHLKNVFENATFSNGSVGKYISPESLNIFFGKNEFGGGLFGLSLLATANLIFKTSVSGLIISSVFIGLCILGIALPKIIHAISSSSKSKVEKKAPVKKSPIKSTSGPSYSKQRIKNINVIKEAKKIDPKNYRSEVSGFGSSVENFEEQILDDTMKETMASRLDDAIFVPEGAQSFSKENKTESSNALSESIFKINSINNGLNSNNYNENVVESESFEMAFEEQEQDNLTDNNPSNNIENVVPTKEEKPQIIVEEKPIFEEPKPIIQEPVKKVKPRVDFRCLTSQFLDVYETSAANETNTRIAEERKAAINKLFTDFKIGAEVVDYTIGPSITRFNIQYAPNVSSRSVNNLVQDISIRLGGVSARFETIVEGQTTSGLEIPNAIVTTVGFKDIYDALPDVKKHPLAVGFGVNIMGDVIWADYDEFPHMLIAGTTGSGKSVMVNEIIATLIMRNSPDDLKLILVDPKKVEMSRYADMPHLLAPIITEPSKVKVCLQKLVDEMEERYALFSKNNATNIKEYNSDCEENGNERLPYIIAILDEYAALIEECKDISMPVVSLAQKARACGIHLMVATQRPSTNVVTGILKANIPTHVALMTANSVDSITIIGEGGAEKLLGRGDMLVQSPLVSRVGVTRLQGCYIDRKEIARVVGNLKEKYQPNYDERFLNLEEPKQNNDFGSTPDINDEDDEETKYQSIKEWVMTQEYMSISKIQRECGVGFNRAGRFSIRLQKEGVLSNETDGNKGYKVLIQDKFGDIDAPEVTSIENSYIKH